MMSQHSKRELVDTIRPRYLKAPRKEKSSIIDEFIAITGYHRKHAIRLLRKGYPARKKKRSGRKKKYQGEVIQALTQIWEICGRICSKRLKPFLPEMVTVLERHKEIKLEAEVKEKLLSMSCATIDRCLQKEHFEKKQGISTTRPGTLLKNAITVRTFTDWNEERPGFMEIDLVAHCGGSAEGQFCYTLTAVDISTGWTECLAVKNRTQEAVFDQIVQLRERLPFPLLGLDSDNGSEFINDMLYRYCMKEKITFTRSRPYRKNDQAHVEQKNWSVVRRTVGYDRYETPEQLSLLQNIYADLRYYVNFFQPVLKTVGRKQLSERKFIKVYDQAATPLHRALPSNEMSIHTKAALINTYLRCNPVALKNKIDDNVAVLWHLSR
jgi:hypothetical protein